MTTFSWLHFTDLHRGARSQKAWWSDWEDKLFEDLRQKHKHTGPWDAVFFTGDLTNRGAKEEFDYLDGFIDKLWSLFDNLQPGHSVALLAVPGNHDLKRLDPEKNPADKEYESDLDLLTDWATREKVRDRFWNEPTGRSRQIVNNVFSNYQKWWMQAQQRISSSVKLKAGLLPGDFSATIEKDGAKIGILGLNSAFLQLSSGDYNRRLALGYRQFDEACGKSGPEWARSHHLCLLLTHHPHEWLCDEAASDFKRIISGKFALHIYGHMHANAYRVLSAGGRQPSRFWQGLSLFGEEKCADNSMDRLFGYTIGQIQFRGSEGELRLWPRKGENVKDGDWEFASDSSGCRLDESRMNATYPEKIDLHFEYKTKVTHATPPLPNTQPGALRVFVGVAASDIEAGKRLSRDLDALRAEGRIADVYVEVFGENDDWSARSRAALEGADLILFVVTDVLVKSRWIRADEIKAVLERHRAKKASVIPILLADCDWQDTPIGTCSSLPPDGRPLRSWENEDSGWRVVGRGVRDATTNSRAARGELAATAVTRSRNDQVREIMQRLGDSTCYGVALLGPMGFHAHELAGEVLQRLQRPAEKLFPIRLLLGRDAQDEEAFYERLSRDLRRPLPREWKGIVDGRSERRAADRFANALEELCENDGPVARSGRRLLLAVDGLPFVETRQLEAWGLLVGRLLGDGLSMLVWGGWKLRELRTRPAADGRFSAFQKLVGIDVRRYSADEVCVLVRARGGSDAAGKVLFEETGGYPALVRESLDTYLDDVLTADRDICRALLLRSETIERLRRTLSAESETTRKAYRDFAQGEAASSRRIREDELERLFWLGVVSKDGQLQWRFTAEVMRQLEVGH